MSNEKFLQQVADYYHKKEINNLTDYTFVFPNKRSAMFMRKYLCEISDKPLLLPRMITITSFIQDYNTSVLATPTELIFILYKVYCRILTRKKLSDQIPEFDKFYFWGNIILNDFNDIDAYLVDAPMLYRNLKGLKEISANYLTQEQKEVIEYLWGTQAIVNDTEKFWNHITENSDNEITQKFLKLWEVMGELYAEFNRELCSLNVPLAYSGLQSKTAYMKIKENGLEDFNGKRFVFIGFNVLSLARTMIFQRLKDLNIAEFFWDTASPLLKDKLGVTNPSGKLIFKLAKALPSPPDFELQEIISKPDIEIIATPSDFGQTKVTAEILKQWSNSWEEEDKGKIKEDRLLETAIILANEELLMPMLYAVPPKIHTINVTMGIPYSTTPFAALISSIICMHLHTWRDATGISHYFYQDVINVLSHPHIVLIAPNEAQEIKDIITTDHIYNVSAADLCSAYPQLQFIFSQVSDDKDLYQIKNYVTTLIDTLSFLLQNRLNDQNVKRHDYYELNILEAYSDAIKEIFELIERYSINMQERTFLQMIERALSLTPIDFVGRPLKGLQIMSVMDTRTLDFDNLIVLSLNERTFPKRNFNPSMIPNSLRVAYYLPTQEHEEISYSYQFYRLISRAKKVRLLYDNRTAGLSSGEMSRYLSQLIHLNPDLNIKKISALFESKIEESVPLVIHKTDEVNGELRQFLPGGDKRLSASALKKYIQCPLLFYLQYVKGLRPNDTILEYIDAGSYGSVLHKVAQDLYENYKHATINEHTIEKMKAQGIEKMALQVLNESYYKGRYTEDLSKMPGEGKIIAKIIAEYIQIMLSKEKTPFQFVGAEVKETEPLDWKINDKYTLRFTMSIDRIDCFTPEGSSERALRFIDYKTGDDELKAPNLEALFTNGKFGGIFQLLLYCHAYAYSENYDGAIKPMIYLFKSIAQGINDLKIGNVTIQDYRQIDEMPDEMGFYERFEELIDKIFETNDDYPFVQTEDIENCRYCPFVQLCGRFVPDKDY